MEAHRFREGDTLGHVAEKLSKWQYPRMLLPNGTVELIAQTFGLPGQYARGDRLLVKSTMSPSEFGGHLVQSNATGIMLRGVTHAMYDLKGGLIKEEKLERDIFIPWSTIASVTE